ncbi:DinB family protein [Nocardia transvalensis]|uniref:DinB family protein n=1 Tax=Nocardia transvalensis TaxID=37333 RepID=UPI001894741A|nr:DinB family protein [Nocardia transvalensis]MBF6327199.1 DinB family protein [Nocardia transvalensis]
MPVSRRDLLRWQFDLTWSLFELHLNLLTAEDCHWEPAPTVWTVRADGDGRWVPDWADTEPDPIPAPTIAWLTWHIGWWWSVTVDHLQGRTPRDRSDVQWPGAAKVAEWLRELRTQWLDVLDKHADADLDAPASFPWGADSGYTVAHTMAWVNAELMKNVSEIGQLRVLRADEEVR